MIGRIDRHVSEILLNALSFSLMVTMSIGYPIHLSSLKWNSPFYITWNGSVTASPAFVVTASLAQSMTWISSFALVSSTKLCPLLLASSCSPLPFSSAVRLPLAARLCSLATMAGRYAR